MSYQQETGANTSYPPGTFGMELLNEQNCNSVVFASEQPVAFEMNSGTTVGITQRTVNDARLRYAGSMPGHVTGHVTGHNATSNKEESDRISQWSQWLKGTAPAPVF